MRLKVQDAAEFVLAHQKKDVFKNHDYAEIIEDIVTAIAQKAFFYVTGIDGKLIGLAICEPDHTAKTLHIGHCLCIQPCLKKFAAFYRRYYPGYKLNAERRNKMKFYNTERLIQLMESNYGKECKENR